MKKAPIAEGLKVSDKSIGRFIGQSNTLSNILLIQRRNVQYFCGVGERLRQVELREQFYSD